VIDAYFVYASELRNSTRVSVFRDYLVKEIGRAKSQLMVVAQQSGPLRNAG
jgi:hypothetical protein